MKMRIALLSAVLFVGQYTFTTENSPQPQANDIVNAEAKAKADAEAKARAEAEAVEKAKKEKEEKAKKEKEEADRLANLKNAGIMTAVTTFALARKDNVLDSLDFIARWSSDLVLKRLAQFECLKGGRFENSIQPVGRAFALGVIGLVVYKAYSMYKAQDEDNDELIFDTEYDDNN